MAVRIEIGITPGTQNISTNSTNVTVELVAVWTGSSYNHQPNQVKGWLKVDGTQYDFTVNKLNPDKTNSGDQIIKTVTAAIKHNAEGEKTLICSASLTTGLQSSGTQTASAELELDRIARVSTPTLSKSSEDMGGSVTINTNRASTALTHDLAYSFAGSAYTNIATGVGASYAWTIPDLASKIPDANSGTVTIRCITKSGSTSVGTKTATMTIKVPTSVVPTISNVATEEATTGLAARFGAYIRYKSKIKATITAAGAKGSTIKSYSTTLGGRAYTGSPFTSQALQSSGTMSLVTTVTDSRGRTAKTTTNITVLDYSPPAISIMQVNRVNAEGDAHDDGLYLAVRYKYSVTSLNSKNTASMVLDFKRSTLSEWTQLQTGTALSADTTVMPASPTFSTDYQYDIRLRVTDWFGTTISYTAALSSGAVVLDIAADGTNISFGKTAEHPNTMESGWVMKSYHGELPRDAITIPGGADLNSYTTPGHYVFAASTYSTIQNIPIGGSASGSVDVFREGDSNQVRQVVTRCSTSSREIWERLYYSNTWQAWQCIHKSGTSRVLWSGAMYMTAGHVAALSEEISKQPNGIILVFSEYVDGEVRNNTFVRHYIDKASYSSHQGAGCCFQMCTSNLAFFATKYLYISNNQITGHANNGLTGTGACGITYTNNRFVLRYVIGV